MSDPKRFDPLSDGMWENSAGEYVLHSDYARLKADVERLRKAGDAVSLCLEAFWKGKPYDTSTNIECFDAWNAAKEGKQP